MEAKLVGMSGTGYNYESIKHKPALTQDSTTGFLSSRMFDTLECIFCCILFLVLYFSGLLLSGTLLLL